MAGPTLGDELAESLYAHVRDGRRRAALDLVVARLRSGTAADAREVTLALAEAQRRVGEQWQRNALTIGQEHSASAIVEDCLGVVAAQLPDPAPDRSVAMVCAEGEWHVTPARMASLLLRAEGWHVTFLGGSMPPEHVHATLDLLRPDFVALSCTLPLALPGAARVADAAHGLGLRVVGGGRAFGRVDHRATTLGLDGWAPDVATAARLLDGWLLALPPAGRRVDLDGEELTLELHEPAIVEAALARLAERMPEVVDADERRRERTREDLAHILQFARVALLCDDPTVFTDFLPWCREVLECRGVPVEALRLGLDVLGELAGGLPRTQWLLAHPV